MLLQPVEWTAYIENSVGKKSWVRRRRWIRSAVGLRTTAAGGVRAGSGCFNDVLPLLKSKTVSVEWLEATAGGPAKIDWMWKEGAIVKNWSRRYWMLWPLEQDPTWGRLLFYFKDTDSTSPSGVIHVPGIQVRIPKTLRPNYFARRLQCNAVVDVTDGPRLELSPRKLIIGAEKEDQLLEWAQVLRTASALGGGGAGGSGEQKPEADLSGWLLKKNPEGIAWWKMRWFELRGKSLMYWDSEQQHTVGEFDLSGYSVCITPVAASVAT